MLTLQGNARLFLCREPVSMKKSFEGLSAIVNELFPEELHSGALFIFISRRRDHMKILSWDGDGFVIFYKRLEQGLFHSNPSTTSRVLDVIRRNHAKKAIASILYEVKIVIYSPAS